MEFFHNFILESCKVSKFTTEVLPVDLNFDSHFVQMINSVNIYHKLIANFGYLKKHMFYLRREYINAPNYQHIVTPSRNSGNFLPASAEASVLHEKGNIASTIP